jgi:2,3,4,5-tetrahydropyridine-2-carboxylate N-succinyltransferase
MNNLEQAIEHCFSQGSAVLGNPYALSAFFSLRDQLEAGTLRAAEPDAASPTGWRVNPWVKRGILLGFRLGNLEDMSGMHPHGQSVLTFVDKHTYPARRFTPAQKVRVVPGGSSVRAGSGRCGDAAGVHQCGWVRG